MTDELEAIGTYEISFDAQLLRDFLAEQWEMVRKELERRGVDGATIPPTADAVTVRPVDAGFTGAEIVVLVSPWIAMALKDVWKEILLPKLKRASGEGSIRETGKGR